MLIKKKKVAELKLFWILYFRFTRYFVQFIGRKRGFVKFIWLRATFCSTFASYS
jgi:hypothetical protein